MHTEEEALGTRLVMDTLSCLIEKEADPSKLIAMSPGGLGVGVGGGSGVGGGGVGAGWGWRADVWRLAGTAEKRHGGLELSTGV